MIKPVFYNSLLVLVLAFLFALPFFGEGIIGYDDTVSVQPNILGAKIFVPAEQPLQNINVIDQLEYKIVMGSKDNTLTVFDAIPSQYASSDFKKILVYPNEIKNLGVMGSLSEDSSEIQFVSNISSQKIPDFTATILITN